MSRLCAMLMGMLLVCFAFVGCSNVGQSFADILEVRNRAQAATSYADPISVAISPYTNGDFGSALGFSVTGYPNDAEISATKFFALDNWFSQIEFVTDDELHLVLRTALLGEEFLTTTYTEPHNASDTARTVDGVLVRTRNAAAGCSMVTWERGDFQFLLHSNKNQGPLSKDIVDTVVTQTSAQRA